MITLDLEQRSQEWHQARLGIPTASNFDKIVTTKGELSKSAEKYMWQLAGERVSGIVQASFKSDYMERGSNVETEAIGFYELIRDTEIKRVGFCLHDSKRYGCSPDGLVGDDGGVQIKCPIISTQVGYLLNGKLPTDYFQQVQGELMITGRKWWDFVSYLPGLKPLIVRVERDEAFISKLESALETFCNELEKIVEKIK